MPLEFVTNSFLPSEKAQGATVLKNAVARIENRMATFGTRERSEPGALPGCVLEGLFYLIALAVIKACPRMPFLLPAPHEMKR
jgi:hypothetical protein